MTETTDVQIHADATKDQIHFPVYMIYSKWSLTQLDRFLETHGGAGLLRIVFGKDDKETDRTIAILSDDTFDSLCEAGVGGANDDKKTDRNFSRGVRVIPFKLNDNSFPGEGRNKSLFIPVPKGLGEDEAWVQETVRAKLVHLAEWGIVPLDSWELHVPLKSREEGGVRGGCFVSFNRTVELERIAMARIALTDTYWPDSEDDKAARCIFHCYWARDRREREEETGDEKKAPRAYKKPYEKKGDGKKAEKGETPQDPEQEKVEKERRKFQKFAKTAQPVARKAPTVPVTRKAPTVPVTVQPTLAEKQ